MRYAGAAGPVRSPGDKLGKVFFSLGGGRGIRGPPTEMFGAQRRARPKRPKVVVVNARHADRRFGAARLQFHSVSGSTRKLFSTKCLETTCPISDGPSEA